MNDTGPRIWIVQCLCPSRHCIRAIAFDPASLSAEAAVGRLRDLVAAEVAGGTLNPWCGLCLSRELSCEARPTRFRTMDEAWPALLESERRQLATRDFFESLRRTDS